MNAIPALSGYLQPALPCVAPINYLPLILGSLALDVVGDVVVVSIVKRTGCSPGYAFSVVISNP